MEYKDYYKLLGVPRGATQAEIKKAYRKLARQHHPDVNKGDVAAERRFKDVNEAHAVLGDAEKRRAYDELGANWDAYRQAASARGSRTGAAGAGAPGADPFSPSGAGSGTAGGPGGGVRFEFRGDAGDLGGYSEFFRTFFGGGRRGQGAQRRRRQVVNDTTDFDELLQSLGGLDMDDVGGNGARSSGAHSSAGSRTDTGRRDIEAEAEISLEEAFTGTNRIVGLDEKRLDVKIPQGVETGQRIRLSGKAGGGPDAGDVYLRVSVREHPAFTRSGADLHRELPITLQEAILGAEVQVETLTGRVLLRIPPETQTDRTIRLAGQGMPRFRGDGRGDLYVKVKIVLPTGLDEEGRRRFRAFAEHVRQPDPRPARPTASAAR